MEAGLFQDDSLQAYLQKNAKCAPNLKRLKPLEAWDQLCRAAGSFICNFSFLWFTLAARLW